MLYKNLFILIATIKNINKMSSFTLLQVCLFGSLANALNVAVLTRRDLASAPINRLLKWLAVADVFVMLEYVPFAIYRYLVSFKIFYSFCR